MRRNSNDDDEYQSKTLCCHICVCEAVCGHVSLNFELIPEKENSGTCAKPLSSEDCEKETAECKCCDGCFPTELCPQSKELAIDN